MGSPPDGEVTFLFTDLQGSTALWDQRPDEMEVALAHHDEVLRATWDTYGGYVFSTAGDSFGVAFGSARAAVDAAIEAQLRLLEPVGGIPLRARMGLHTGTATMRDDDYFGTAVNRGARISAAAHGGQILISEATLRALGSELPPDTEVRFLGLHRLKDLVEPERIHQVNHAALDSEFPRIKTLEGPDDGLPIPLTTFIGRDRELSEIQALLSEHRLLTLTGSGGAGKTRLALRTAFDTSGSFADGIRLVELAAITDPDVFVDEVADRFHVQAERDTPIVDTLTAFIGAREMLLVLDNCEQIVAAAAELSRRLLSACRGLRIIATSRVRLGVDGEVTYRVPSLGLPPLDIDAGTSEQYDAVRLFVDRARLATPTFAITSANVADVAAICRRLDGIPLALELAAARVRSMSPAQIASRLDERFRLLTAGSDPGRHERQQTLLAAIEWSHNLLSEEEQITFRRLSPFVSDFGLEAAEHVCSGGPIVDLDVVDLLTSLVDKSMVSPEIGRDDQLRHQLLETLREFGLRQLELSGERAEVFERFVDWCAAYAESLQRIQRGGDLHAAQEMLQQEEDNIRSSLRYALDHGLLVHAARLVGALGYLWYMAGLHREGIEWCEELFQRDPELPDEIRAQALHSYGTLLGSWTRPDLGVELIGEEVEIRRRLDHPARLASALNNLGNLLYDVGRFDEADLVLREAATQFRLAGEHPTLTLCSLAFGRMHVGRYDQAEALYAEALAEAQAASDRYGLALSTSGLGQCAARTARYDEARTNLLVGRDAFEELKVTPGIADADFHLALVERATGHDQRAASRLLLSLTTQGAHWYDDTKWWIAQVAASLVDDPRTASKFIGAAAAHYDSASVNQPLFVLDDLAAMQEQLRAGLDHDDFERSRLAGTRLDQAQLFAEVADALGRLAPPEASDAPGGTS